MRYDLVYYWEKFLENEKEFGLKLDSYILSFTIVNQSTNEIFNDWLSFPDAKALLGFIKYVVLPSGYISRAYGKIYDTVYVVADTFDSVIDLLKAKGEFEELVSNFNNDYSKLESFESKEFSVDIVNNFCRDYNAHLDEMDIVFSTIEVYPNIKEVGFSLVEEYEKKGMIDQLEEQMDLSKEEILDVFSNIQNNKFMLKRINEFLSNKMLI